MIKATTECQLEHEDCTCAVRSKRRPRPGKKSSSLTSASPVGETSESLSGLVSIALPPSSSPVTEIGDGASPSPCRRTTSPEPSRLSAAASAPAGDKLVPRPGASAMSCFVSMEMDEPDDSDRLYSMTFGPMALRQSPLTGDGRESKTVDMDDWAQWTNARKGARGKQESPGQT